MSADSPLGLAQHKRCTFSAAQAALVVKLPCTLIEAMWPKHPILKVMICKNSFSLHLKVGK